MTPALQLAEGKQPPVTLGGQAGRRPVDPLRHVAEALAGGAGSSGEDAYSG